MRIKYWDILIVVAVIFWGFLIYQYWNYYQACLQEFYLLQGRSFIAVERFGQEINYIWFRFAQIGLMAFATVGGLLYFRNKA